MVTEIDELIGKTFDSVRSLTTRLDFISVYGDSYKFYHNQDCCEYVRIVDICGSLDDLAGSPIIRAEVRTSKDQDSVDPDEIIDSSNTWTFYEFATIKGSVTVRWLGSSNGYYSEEVDFVKFP